jgi:uncharacterized membrane protein
MRKQIKLVLFSILVTALIAINVVALRESSQRQIFLSAKDSKYDSLLLVYKDLQLTHIKREKEIKEYKTKDSLKSIVIKRQTAKDSVLKVKQEILINKYKNLSSSKLLNVLDSLYTTN